MSGGSTAATIDSKQAERRSLHFDTLDDVLADVQGRRADSVRATGNWTPAQIVQHVTKLITGSIDGFDVTAPFLFRLIGRAVPKGILKRPFKPGIKLPASMSSFIPDPDVRWDDAVAELAREVGRARDGRMIRRSPLLGKMRHADWVNLHCRHAEMHFGFIHPVA